MSSAADYPPQDNAAWAADPQLAHGQMPDNYGGDIVYTADPRKAAGTSAAAGAAGEGAQREGSSRLACSPNCRWAAGVAVVFAACIALGVGLGVGLKPAPPAAAVLYSTSVTAWVALPGMPCAGAAGDTGGVTALAASALAGAATTAAGVLATATLSSCLAPSPAPPTPGSASCAAGVAGRAGMLRSSVVLRRQPGKCHLCLVRRVLPGHNRCLRRCGPI